MHRRHTWYSTQIAPHTWYLLMGLEVKCICAQYFAQNTSRFVLLLIFKDWKQEISLPLADFVLTCSQWCMLVPTQAWVCQTWLNRFRGVSLQVFSFCFFHIVFNGSWEFNGILAGQVHNAFGIACSLLKRSGNHFICTASRLSLRPTAMFVLLRKQDVEEPAVRGSISELSQVRLVFCSAFME